MSINAASEISLVKASLNGRTEAFEILIKKYQSLVCAMTYNATGNLEASEELAQDTFVRAWSHLIQLEDHAKFKSWLCGITRRSIQNWIRAKRRDPVKASDLENPPTTPPDPAQIMITQEREQLVHQALTRLPENLRMPLILFYREQQSSKEVAKQLNLSDQAARQRIARGRQQLREHLQAVVEQTLSQTKPGQAFAATVLAAITAQAVKSTAVAAAANSPRSGLSSVLSATAAKVAVTAAGLAIVTGAVWLHQTTRAHTQDGVPSAASVAAPEASLLPEPVPQQPTSATAPIASTQALGSDTTGKSQAVTESLPRSQPTRPKEIPFRFKPQGILSGQITDKVTGRPVTDATVRLMGRFADVRTDTQGVYVFDTIPKAANYEISIHSKTHIGIDAGGHSSPKISLDPNQASVKHFEVERACMVDVYVVDEEGQAIANAEVIGTDLAVEHPRVINYFPGLSSDLTGRPGFGTYRKTDASGHVRLGGFPAAETNYQITVWHKDRNRDHTHAPGHAVVQLMDPDIVPNIRIVLKKGTSVRGTIAYADGVPGNDLRIHARPEWWHSNVTPAGCLPDPNGYFTLTHIVPGDYRIWVIPIQDGGHYETVLETTLPQATNDLLTLQSSRLSPESLVSISGEVIYPDGLDSDNINVEAISAQRKRTNAYIQRDRFGRLESRFQINRLEPGSYRLKFSGNKIADQTIRDVTAPCDDMVVELTYPPSFILTGEVLDEHTGQPIEAYQVRLNKTVNYADSHYDYFKHWIDIRDKAGVFSVEARSPGHYEIQIVAPGYAPQWTKKMDTNVLVPMAIHLRSGGRITGTVTNAQGQPVHDAQIIPLSLACSNDWQGRHRFVTSRGAVITKQGQFTLNHIPAGTESLKVVHESYSFTVVKDIAVQDGQTTGPIHITLPEAASIQGTIYDSNGLALVHETVLVREPLDLGNPEQLGIATTDANGFYRIDGLPAKYVSIARRQTAQSLGVVKRSLVLTPGVPHEVSLGGAPVLAGTIELTTQISPHQRLALCDENHVELSTYINYTRIDPHGAFVFTGTEPGPFKLFMEDPNHANEWNLITEVDVPARDLDVGHLHAATRTLKLTIRTDQAGAAIHHIYVAKPGQMFSTSLAVGRRPTQATGPWQFHNLKSGTYDIVVSLENQSQWRKTIQFDPQQSPLTLTLETGTAQLSGKLLGDSPSSLVFWRRQRDFYHVFKADSHRQYEITQIPAGNYAISTVVDFMNNGPALAEFTLQNHQDHVQDITLPEQSAASGLIVKLSDSQGRPIQDATVTLASEDQAEAPLQAIQQINTYILLGKPRDYVLTISASGYQPLSKPVKLKAIIEEGTPPETMEITLEMAKD